MLDNNDLNFDIKIELTEHLEKQGYAHCNDLMNHKFSIEKKDNKVEEFLLDLLTIDLEKYETLELTRYEFCLAWYVSKTSSEGAWVYCNKR